MRSATATEAALADGFATIALAAGARIMAIYGAAGAPAAAAAKADGSPLTEADLAAEAVTAAGLARLCPDIPVVSEEGAGAAAPPPGRRFILVDPLDGTREFIDRTAEFTVNIALVEDGEPVCGVVHAPALGRLWLGDVAAARAESRGAGPGPGHPIRVRPAPAEGLIAVASRSHRDPETDAFLARLSIGGCRPIGSSLKFCLVAEGASDVYPRFGPTMEWDTAAGHAVLAAAGGRLTAPDGGPFRYGKHHTGFRNGPFIAWGGALPATVRAAPGV